MEPAAGVVPYSVLIEPWNDGAKAQRWVAIPGTTEIELAASPIETSKFPEGTVLVKHLTLPQPGGEPIRLETQLLHHEGGVWSPYSYLWDDSNRDATLVDAIGTNRPLPMNDSTAANGFGQRHQ
jgi:hypothetical protein